MLKFGLGLLSSIFLFILSDYPGLFARETERVKEYVSEGQKFTVETLVNQDDVIWGFDFLDENRIIFTERSGKILVYDLKSRKLDNISGAPAVFAEGQGGLLDIRVHPKNGWIYLTYSEPLPGDKATSALARAKLEGQKLVQLQKLFSAHQPNGNVVHFGSRVEFDGKGHLYVSVGDRGERHQAQDLKYHQGKILRFHEDGQIPKDNPFMNDTDAKDEIWSYGHRNPQGLAIHPSTGELWEAEFGPRGGDELNLIQPGKNYGWPIVTHGREYHGPRIGVGTSKPGMEDPITYWAPSISPSAISFYNGTHFPKWKENLFLANLSATHIRRLELDGKKVVKQEEILKDLDHRFRNLRQGPDGLLYLSTDEGKILRINPVK